MLPAPALASVADTLRSLWDDLTQFFQNLAQVRAGYLALALAAFSAYLVCRGIASYNALRGAYPDRRFQLRRIWGAYVAAFALNGVVPAGGGSIVQMVLSKVSIEESSYATVSVALCSVIPFDALVGAGILGYAFTQNIFPKPSDFSSVDSFDISFFAGHPDVTLFIVTALLVSGLVAYAVVSMRVVALAAHLRQGLRVFRMPGLYLLGMCAPQLLGWALRGVAYLLLLDAWGLPGSLHSAMLILAVQVVAAIFPFTPGGAGVQQALLIAIFDGAASASTVTAFSVGQQVALVAFSWALGFAAIALIFRYRSFRALLRDARIQHRSERATERAARSGSS